MDCAECRKLERARDWANSIYVRLKMAREMDGTAVGRAERTAQLWIARAEYALTRHWHGFCSRTLRNRLSVGLKVGILKSAERGRFEK